MTETLTRDDFSKRLNQKFRVTAGETTLECELVECRPILESREVEEGRREPFSVIFRGPMEPVMAQQTWHLENDEMGALEIFLVPIGPDQQGMRYEAVFT